MAYQRGSLKQVSRWEGATWVLRYRIANGEGRRVENTAPVGLVRDFPKENDAWREIDRLGLLTRINSDTPCPGHTRFDSLAEHYLKADFGADAIRPKSANTITIVEHYVRDYLIAVSAARSPTTSSRSTCSAGLNRCTWTRDSHGRRLRR